MLNYARARARGAAGRMRRRGCAGWAASQIRPRVLMTLHWQWFFMIYLAERTVRLCTGHDRRNNRRVLLLFACYAFHSGMRLTYYSAPGAGPRTARPQRAGILIIGNAGIAQMRGGQRRAYMWPLRRSRYFGHHPLMMRCCVPGPLVRTGVSASRGLALLSEEFGAGSCRRDESDTGRILRGLSIPPWCAFRRSGPSRCCLTAAEHCRQRGLD